MGAELTPYLRGKSNVYRSRMSDRKAKSLTASGLDARYMISRLKPPNVDVLSLTTIASPHRGSAFADYVFDRIGRKWLAIYMRPSFGY